METGELTAVDIDPNDEWKCPFAHEKKGKVTNDLTPNNSAVLQRSLENGTSTRRWDDSTGKIVKKRVKEPALVDARTSAVPLPHTVQVILDHLGNTVTLPFSLSAHHLIPSDASLPKSSLKHYIEGGPVIESDIGYGVNGSENGVWLPTHQELSQNMPILPFETDRKKYADISNEGDDRVGSTISFYVDAVMEKTDRQFHDAHHDYSNFVTGVLNKIQTNLVLIKNDRCDKCKQTTQSGGKLPPPHQLVSRLNGVSARLKPHLLGNPLSWRSPVFTSRFARDLRDNTRSLMARGRA